MQNWSIWDIFVLFTIKYRIYLLILYEKNCMVDKQ